MDIGFDEALRVARRCVADRTGDHEATVVKYEKGEGHYFQFRTRKGDRGVVVDKRGMTRHCFEDSSESYPGDLTAQEAMDKALDLTGGGKVERA